MKALSEYFLMVVFTMLLGRVHVFENYIFNFEQRNMAVKEVMKRSWFCPYTLPVTRCCSFDLDKLEVSILSSQDVTWLVFVLTTWTQPDVLHSVNIERQAEWGTSVPARYECEHCWWEKSKHITNSFLTPCHSISGTASKFLWKPSLCCLLNEWFSICLISGLAYMIMSKN